MTRACYLEYSDDLTRYPIRQEQVEAEGKVSWWA